MNILYMNILYTSSILIILYYTIEFLIWSDLPFTGLTVADSNYTSIHIDNNNSDNKLPEEEHRIPSVTIPVVFEAYDNIDTPRDPKDKLEAGAYLIIKFLIIIFSI